MCGRIGSERMLKYYDIDFGGKMEYYVELKLRGDAHPDGFANGMSLCRSQSSRSLEKVSETDAETVYKNPHNHTVVMNKTRIGDAVALTTTFTNTSDGEAVLEMLSSFAVRGIKADKIHRLQSFWSAEGKLRTETVEELHLEPSWNRCATRIEKFGNIGSMPVRKYFPFIALEDSESGKFVAVQLYIPYSWQIEIFCKEDDSLSIAGGIADRDFGHWFKRLAPGESFTAPKAVIAEGDSLYDVCDKLVKAQSPKIAPVDENMGIAFNEYCTTWGNPSFENMKRISDRLKGKGVQYLVMDSGWYGHGDGWWRSIGDWEVNEEKFPGGLKPTADYIRSCGMIPGIWFEFESVGTGSKYYESEHLLKKDGCFITVGERRFWDMEDPWVIDYLTERVIKLLKDNGFGYVKVDYNDTIGIGCDGAESLGEGLRRRVEATHRFFEKIREEIPGIVIENCSSGGHRSEPSMMELCSQGSFSDAHETAAIPIIAANMHRVMLPSQSQIWAVMRPGDSSDRIHYSICNTFLGRMCLSGDIYGLADWQWALIDEGMEFYRRAADVIKHGRTVRIESSPKSYNSPTGEQVVVREYNGVTLVVAHRFANSKPVDLSFLNGRKLLCEYGELERDFSAKAWLLG